ncbi:Uncharacterised protein [Weissella viridescens]|uniref:Uncharacterized protein n=1 Tax=Weissella viridescens TaxID=1629 RepID=A0A380NYC9_WEIVI|nr:Uncharacterised protein [Weissella viridescens]
MQKWMTEFSENEHAVYLHRQIKRHGWLALGARLR